MEPMFNFNGGARADLMAAVEELERHNEQESRAVLSLFQIARMLGARFREYRPRLAPSVCNTEDHATWEPYPRTPLSSRAPLEMSRHELSFAYFPNHGLI